MPSKGSPIVHVRFPVRVLEMMDEFIARTETTRKQAPHTRTSFILAAVREVLGKADRRKRSLAKKKAAK